MTRALVAGPGGRLILPEPANLLASREDGGHLVVLPPCDVWERRELDREELRRARGRAHRLTAFNRRAMLPRRPG